jgi:hypothetical protein
MAAPMLLSSKGTVLRSPKHTTAVLSVKRNTGKSGHKEQCQNLKSRKTILRAAETLKKIMISVPRHAAETKFETAMVVHDRAEGLTGVLLKGYAWRYEGHRIVPGPFSDLPDDIDRDTAEGIMMLGSGELALGDLGVWIEQLLPGKSIREPKQYSPVHCQTLILRALCPAPTFTVEEVHVAIDERTPTTLGIMMNCEPTRGLKGVEILESHSLWRVTLPQSGEIWGVDITGIQFGHRELIYPWSKVEAPDHRGGKVKRTYSIGSNASMFLRLQQPGRQEILEELNMTAPAMAHVHGGEGAKLSQVMEAPKARKEILDTVERFFNGFSAGFFSPEKMRGYKEADEPAALGPETPEYQSQVKDLKERILRPAEKVGTTLSAEERTRLMRTNGECLLAGLHPHAQYFAVWSYIVEAEKLHRSGHWLKKDSEGNMPGPRKIPPIYVEVMSDFFPKRTWPNSVFEVPKPESSGVLRRTRLRSGRAKLSVFFSFCTRSPGVDVSYPRPFVVSLLTHVDVYAEAAEWRYFREGVCLGVDYAGWNGQSNMY